MITHATSSVLVRDMLEAPEVLRRFNPRGLQPWADELCHKKILVTGEGSSRIFPAHNMKAQALRAGKNWSLHIEGARQAAEYNLEGYAVLGSSNSGQTRELIDLFIQLREQKIPCYGVTATPGSRLTEVAHKSMVLSCGAEGAVAATKSVIEQALVFQALLQENEWQEQAKAADLCDELLKRSLPVEIVKAVAGASCVYFAGRDDGVAEELALKANEILRRRSIYLEGTAVLHGVEETMEASEVLVLLEPFQSEMDKIRAVIQQGAGMKVIALSSYGTPFPTIALPRVEGFNGYLQLMAGWNLLVSAGIETGVDIDRPLRARKVGNAV